MVGLGMLWAGLFDARLALCGGLLLGACVGMWGSLGSRESVPASARFAGGVVVTVLLAMCFRYEPVRFVGGGHDSGVYVNLGVHLTEAPSPVHQDPVGALQTPEERVDYLDSASEVVFDGGGIDGYVGTLLPGVYLADAEESTLVFQFYHFPAIWMAYFGTVLGKDNGVWANTVLGLLALVNFVLITARLTGGFRWGFLIGVLFAVNPIHAYFSRVPVSEMSTLFCSSSALYFLLLSLDRNRRSIPGSLRPLALAVVFFTLLCFTRISGFMYVPFLAASLLLLFVIPVEEAVRRRLRWAVVGCLGGFALSVVYGLQTSFPYCVDQYGKCFQPIFGSRWREVISVVVPVGLVALVAASLAAWRGWGLDRILSWVYRHTTRIVSCLFGLFILVHVWKIARLAVGDHYADHILAGIRFPLYDKGWDSVGHSSLLILALMAGPGPVLGFLGGLFSARGEGVTKRFLLIFLAGFLGYLAVLQWVLPYQYYWGRYLLSEALPYVLLFGVLVLADFGKSGMGWAIRAIMCVSVVFSGLLTSVQWRYTDPNSFARTLDAAVSAVGENDLVLLRKSMSATRLLQTPLRYYQGFRVAVFENREELEGILHSEWISKADDVWLFEDGGFDPGGVFELRDRVTLRRRTPEKATLLPLKLEEARMRLSVYRWNRLEDVSPVIWDAQTVVAGGAFHGLHSDRVWTGGRASFDFPWDPEGEPVAILEIELFGWTNPAINFEERMIQVSLNGVSLKELERSPRGLRFSIPRALLRDGLNRLEIASDTFVPSELGESADQRELGLDLKRVALKDADDAKSAR